MELAAELWYADGTVKRFGGDEERSRDLPSNIGWNTQIPGGFDTGSLTLPRLPNLYADEAKLFSHVRVYGRGNRTFYEGRVTGVPQVGVQEINLETEGWVASLTDNEYFERLYLDSDLSAWQEPSTTRQIALIVAGSPHISGGGLRNDKLATALTTPWSANLRNEMWYRGRLSIGSVWYSAADGSSGGIGALAGTETVAVQIADSESNTVGSVTTGNLAVGPAGPLPVTSTLTATAETQKAATVRFVSSAANAGTSSIEYPVNWLLVVVGTHGLTTSALSTGAPALKASDIVADAVALGAPRLTYSTGATGSIESTATLISQAVYHSTTARAVVEEMTLRGATNAFLPDWGVYDGREFFWRSPGSYGRQWHVSREDITPTYSGPDIGERCRGVVITYQSVGGDTLSVGFTGSGADYETSVLMDPNSNSTRIKLQDIGISYQEAAVVIGQLLLTEQNRLIQRGSITFSGTVTGIDGSTHPVAAIRAGDRVSVQEDVGAVVPISNTSYNHDDLTLTADLGAPSHSSDALFAQLGAG